MGVCVHQGQLHALTENILKRDENGYSAVVADFGLAEKILMSARGSEKLAVVGSPFWMAPEVLRDEPCEKRQMCSLMVSSSVRSSSHPGLIRLSSPNREFRARL